MVGPRTGRVMYSILRRCRSEPSWITLHISHPIKSVRRDYLEDMRMTRTRKLAIAILLVVLSTALVGAFLTRGVMEYLPFLQAKKGNWTGEYVSHGIVDQRPWQTAATLSGMAQSAEEREFAREAERLADHEVDQAFSQSLRQAGLEKPKL